MHASVFRKRDSDQCGPLALSTSTEFGGQLPLKILNVRGEVGVNMPPNYLEAKIDG